jgi:uncharacterized delta-60 repeat protein
LNTFNPLPSYVSRLAIAASTIAFAVLLSACGGGSSSGTVTPPPPGTLDSGFGSGGTVTTPFGLGAQARAVALQPDGKIVAAGIVTLQTSVALALIRYNADGTPDTGFGTGGKVDSSSFASTISGAAGVTLQPDGKIVVAGSSRPANLDVCTVFRLNANGSLDTGFGNGGVALSGVTVALTQSPECNAPTVLPDGKILVAVGGSSGSSGRLGLIRFKSDGSPDLAFGVGGVAVVGTTNNIVQGRTVTVQPDGKTIAGGSSGYWAGATTPFFIAEYVLARFDAAGVLDPTFGQNGVIHGSSEMPPTGVYGAALQPDNKIVVEVGGNDKVLRLLPDGTPDSTFRVDGALTVYSGAGIALQSNGKIVIAETMPGEVAGTSAGFRLVRLNPDGAVDPGFGNGGSVTTPIGSGGWAKAVAIQRDGRIVVAGWATIGPLPPLGNPPANFALAKYFGEPVMTSSQ